MFRFLFQPRSLFIFIFIMATMVILVGIVSFFPLPRVPVIPLCHTPFMNAIKVGLLTLWLYKRRL